jgi:hypothetical protein
MSKDFNVEIFNILYISSGAGAKGSLYLQLNCQKIKFRLRGWEDAKFNVLERQIF